MRRRRLLAHVVRHGEARCARAAAPGRWSGDGSSAAKAAIGAVGESTKSNGAAGRDRGVAHRARSGCSRGTPRSPLKPRAAVAPIRGCRAAPARAARRGSAAMSSQRAHAPEVVHAVEHRARHEGRASARRSAPARSKRCAAASTAARDLGLDRQAAAGVQQQADAQAAQIVALEPLPGDRPARGRLMRVARVGLREHAASSAPRRRRCASSARRRGRCRAGRSGCGRGSA